MFAPETGTKGSLPYWEHHFEAVDPKLARLMLSVNTAKPKVLIQTIRRRKTHLE
jgi:hypothetical protein